MPRFKLSHPCCKSLNQTANEMGFSLSDIPGLDSVVTSVQTYTQSTLIDPIKETAIEYAGADKVDAWGNKLESAVTSQASSLEASLKDKATAYAQDYMTAQAGTKSVQDAGIKGAFDAFANSTIQMKDTFLSQGVMGFAKTYPIVTGVAVGVPSILFLKWLIGQKRVVRIKA